MRADSCAREQARRSASGSGLSAASNGGAVSHDGVSRATHLWARNRVRLPVLLFVFFIGPTGFALYYVLATGPMSDAIPGLVVGAIGYTFLGLVVILSIKSGTRTVRETQAAFPDAYFVHRAHDASQAEPPRRVRRLFSLRLLRLPESGGERSEPVRPRPA